MRKLGDMITLDFTTHNPSTGMVQDADLLPICEVFDNNIDIPILTPVVIKRTGQTGDYRVSIEATIGNGFGVGRTYNVIASATVNSVSAKARIGIFVLDSKSNQDVVDEVGLMRTETDKIQDIVEDVSLVKIETDKVQDLVNEVNLVKDKVTDVTSDVVLIKSETDKIQEVADEIDLVKIETDKISGLVNTVDLVKTEVDKIQIIKPETDKIQDIVEIAGLIKPETNKIQGIANKVVALQEIVAYETDKIQHSIADEVGKIQELTGEIDLVKIETDKIQSIAVDTKFIREVESGKWEIKGSQMIFYSGEDSVELMRFDITKDASGNAIMRTRVL